MPEWRKLFEAEDSDLSPPMASVAYRAKVEERYQANALVGAAVRPGSCGRAEYLRTPQPTDFPCPSTPDTRNYERGKLCPHTRTELFSLHPAQAGDALVTRSLTTVQPSCGSQPNNSLVSI